MTIRINNFGKSNGIWNQDYSFDNTQNDLINDEFFDYVEFIKRIKTDVTVLNWFTYFCNAEDFVVFNMAQNIMSCPQSVNISFSQGFKFAQSTFRYVDEDFTYFCTDLYQDTNKISCSVKGIGNCEIEDVYPIVFIQSAIDFISGMSDVYALELYRKIKGISLPEIG